MFPVKFARHRNSTRNKKFLKHSRARGLLPLLRSRAHNAVRSHESAHAVVSRIALASTRIQYTRFFAGLRHMLVIDESSSQSARKVFTRTMKTYSHGLHFTIIKYHIYAKYMQASLLLSAHINWNLVCRTRSKGFYGRFCWPGSSDSLTTDWCF